MVRKIELIFKSVAFSVVAVMLWSCHGEDVSGHIVGTWSSEWTDDVGGDLDDISVTEYVEFTPDTKSGNSGTFVQLFEGNVKYDDWENEGEVEYMVVAEGKWRVKDNDEVVMTYNMNNIDVQTGKCSIEPDYTEAGIALLSGDLSGLISGAMEVENSKKASREVNEKINKGVTSYFRDMFRNINKDKEAMTGVKIVDDVMTCSVNRGTFGRKQDYDRVTEAAPRSGNESHSGSRSGSKSKSRPERSNNYIETDDDSSESETMTLSGTVAGQRVVMELTFMDGEVTGRYRYNKIQPPAWMTLQGNFDGNSIEMTEFNPNGERCGSFSVTLNHNSVPKTITGSMVNYKGKTYGVNLVSD